MKASIFGGAESMEHRKLAARQLSTPVTPVCSSREHAGEAESWARNICTTLRREDMTGRKMWWMTCAARKRCSGTMPRFCKNREPIGQTRDWSLARQNERQNAAGIIGSALERSSLFLLIETLTTRIQRSLRSRSTFFYAKRISTAHSTTCDRQVGRKEGGKESGREGSEEAREEKQFIPQVQCIAWI